MALARPSQLAVYRENACVVTPCLCDLGLARRERLDKAIGFIGFGQKDASTRKVAGIVIRNQKVSSPLEKLLVHVMK